MLYYVQADSHDTDEAIEMQKKKYSPKNMSRDATTEFETDDWPKSPSTHSLSFLDGDPLARHSSVSEHSDDLLGCVHQTSGELILQSIDTVVEKKDVASAGTSSRPTSGTKNDDTTNLRKSESLSPEAKEQMKCGARKATHPAHPLSPLRHFTDDTRGDDVSRHHTKNQQDEALQNFRSQSQRSLSERRGLHIESLTAEELEPDYSTSKSSTETSSADQTPIHSSLNTKRPSQMGNENVSSQNPDEDSANSSGACTPGSFGAGRDGQQIEL